VKSQDIRVGDIVHVKDGMEFPCDLVLIGSSQADGGCFVMVQ